MSKKMFVLTSGGDASYECSNKSCTKNCLNRGFEVFGIKRGYLGMLNDEIFPWMKNLCQVS